ncbi:MAG: hypothetical protein MR210_04010 [Erysipelotrichaceae bacterium]|nr:hypothetical protein [Erysipelotrichaceae bacterium]MDY5251641.1 hypothetical protein [Erysipelotrichaceae bacterium]
MKKLLILLTLGIIVIGGATLSVFAEDSKADNRYTDTNYERYGRRCDRYYFENDDQVGQRQDYRAYRNCENMYFVDENNDGICDNYDSNHNCGRGQGYGRQFRRCQ